MLTIGIVGLPNVGKSTLFNSLTKGSALVANYPFATIEPNVGIVPIPDMRLSALAEMYHSEKIVPANIKFIDIAGLVSGASKGEGLGNQFLSHVRSCQVIIQVVRAFDDSNVIHVDNQHSPSKDIATINTELILADIQTLTKRLPILEKETKANPKLKPMLEIYKKAYELLNNNQPLWSYRDTDWELLDELQLLTNKPIIYVFNVDEQNLNNSDKIGQLEALVKPLKPIIVSAKLEAELSELDEADRLELLGSYNQKESGLNSLINAAYETLGLHSFLTAGKKEVRAWAIKRGWAAPQAAGVIHSDFERGFIAAEVVNYEDLIASGSLANAKAVGKVRTEGKTYIVKPNDVIEFRFNV